MQRGGLAQVVAAKPIRFLLSSPYGHVEALTLTGDLPIAEIMAQLCWQLIQSGHFMLGLSFEACHRVVSDVDLGFSVFLSTYHESAGEHWLDFEPSSHYPSVLRLPLLLTEASLSEQCPGVSPRTHFVAVSGVPWDGEPRALQHADVVLVREHPWQLYTVPLLAMEQRADGITMWSAGTLHPSRYARYG